MLAESTITLTSDDDDDVAFDITQRKLLSLAYFDRLHILNSFLCMFPFLFHKTTNLSTNEPFLSNQNDKPTLSTNLVNQPCQPTLSTNEPFLSNQPVNTNEPFLSNL
jgi:hypothetical protein